MGAGSWKPRVGPRNPRKQIKGAGRGQDPVVSVSSHVAQKLPKPEMWRALRHVASGFSSKPGKENEGKERPTDSPSIVLQGGNMGHVAKADLISQFPKDPISPAALLT